jgi:hypothetical protein
MVGFCNLVGVVIGPVSKKMSVKRFDFSGSEVCKSKTKKIEAKKDIHLKKVTACFQLKN